MPTASLYQPPALPQGQWFNVMQYGAVGNNVNDDAPAIQAAITAAQNAGGSIVFFPTPPTNYLIGSPLTVSADNIYLLGAGWGAQILPTSSFGTNPLLQIQKPASGFRYGVRVQDIFFNGNSVAGVGGIECDSTYGLLIDHCRIRYIAANSIYIYGTNTPQTAAYDCIRNCHITDGSTGSSIGLLTDIAEWIEISGGLFSWFNIAGAIGVKIQGLNCSITGTQFDYNDIAVELSYVGRATIAGCQFDRGITNFLSLQGSEASTIVNNAFMTAHGVNTTPAIKVSSAGNRNNIISGNTFYPNYSGKSWAYAIQEDTSTGFPSNLYTGNAFANLPVSLYSGIARNNTGYNPLITLIAPLAPTLSTATTGGTVAAGTYQVEVTYVNGAGETTGSTSASIATTGSTSTITIISPVAEGNAFGWYAYVTQVGGVTYTLQQTAGSPTPISTNLTLTAPPTSTGANPPAGNTTAGVTTPAVPSTGIRLQNTAGVDCTVYVTGGTLTGIDVNNTGTGATGGAILLPAYCYITLHYSAVPTWVWIGN